jgi:hypothetical protein
MQSDLADDLSRRLDAECGQSVDRPRPRFIFVQLIFRVSLLIPYPVRLYGWVWKYHCTSIAVVKPLRTNKPLCVYERPLMRSVIFFLIGRMTLQLHLQILEDT